MNTLHDRVLLLARAIQEIVGRQEHIEDYIRSQPDLRTLDYELIKMVNDLENEKRPERKNPCDKCDIAQRLKK